jgi:hypothetical protein
MDLEEEETEAMDRSSTKGRRGSRRAKISILVLERYSLYGIKASFDQYLSSNSAS